MEQLADIQKRCFVRSDGKPFKIIARGDCTSRRSIHLNQSLFPHGMEFIQNQKSPAIFFLDALRGSTCVLEDLHELSDVSLMPGSLPDHYLGQCDRSILEQTDVDLIVIDSWAEMNFDIWEHKKDGWKCWIHPKYLRDKESFHASFNKLGKRTLIEAVNDNVALIAQLRKRNPDAPVLLLNQQTDFYSRISERREFYNFGKLLEARVASSYFGGTLEKNELNLADVGSCGPGQTLHYSGNTYLKMINTALDKGLEVKVCKELDPNIFFAADNPEKTHYPHSFVNFGYDSSLCRNSRTCVDKTYAQFGSYIRIPGVSGDMRWTPVVIDVAQAQDYESWERVVKKRYDRLRMKNRSVRNGYVVHRFHPKLFVPDMHEIHHSSDVRSGGAMRGDYLQDINEMGGYPDKYLDVQTSQCPLHWGYSFGVFKEEIGHRQGDVLVDERLVGYINIRRSGDILLYSRIMGHSDHLDNGVMYHLHFDIVKWCVDSQNPLTAGLKFVMYGGVGNGGPSLWQWKRTVGFKPQRLTASN